MRKNTIILMLMFLAAAFQWGCQKEVVTPEDEDISLRNPKPHDHGGGGGGGSKAKPLYQIDVTGDIVYGDVTYGIFDGSNKKADNISGNICGATLLHGINILAINGNCYTSDPYCGLRNVGINHKNKNPGFVSTLFIFQRYEGSSQTRFLMYGYIDGGGTSLFPTDPLVPVVVTLDRYKITIGPPECEVPEFTFLPPASYSTMTITLLTETDPAVVCAGITPCVAAP
jgi:hypothetical protein